MLVTHDIFSLTVLFIVLLCVAFKGGRKRKSPSCSLVPKSKEELQEEEYKRQDYIVSRWKQGFFTGRYESEYVRYILWLYKYRDGKVPPTLAEIYEDIRIRKEKEAEERKDKRLYEWWLFKHSDEYEKELAEMERCVSR